MTRIQIQLSDVEVAHAVKVGRTRYRVQRQGGRNDGRVTPTADGETIDIQGALAEYAFAQFLNCGWAGALNLRDWEAARTEAGLVGGIRVRSTNYPNGCLPLHDQDPEDVPHVLVNTHRCPSIEIVGWTLPRLARYANWWREDIARPCYLIPEKFLREADAEQLLAAVPPPPPTPHETRDWSWLPNHTVSLTEAAQRYVQHHFWVDPLRDLQFTNPLRTPEAQGKAGCTCSEGTTCRQLGLHLVSHTFPGCRPERVANMWRHAPSTRIGIRTGGASRLLVVVTRAVSTVDGPLPITLTHQTGDVRAHFYNVPHGLWLPRSQRFAAGLEILCEGGLIAVAPSTQVSGEPAFWIPAPIVDLPSWLTWFMEALRA